MINRTNMKNKYLVVLLVTIVFGVVNLNFILPVSTNNQNGFQLLESNCFSCHSPDPEATDKVAPTMAEIKTFYITEYKSEQDFTEQFIDFLNNPNPENAKMGDALKQYGEMPKMSFSDMQIKDIASYVYQTPLEKKEWFEKEYNIEKEKNKNAEIITDPIEKGLQIAMQTKGVLGKNLMNAIKTKGTDDALLFCSLKAITLTDSVAISLKAKVKRVSDRNRNPQNAANKDELDYIVKSKEKLQNGEKLTPQMKQTDDKVICYYPITTNGMCLQCHGAEGSDIQVSTISKIRSIYPDDKAIGYKADELRGIWVVEMDK